jgi:ABC-type Fe3+ transport system substrate-binding protein
MFWERFQDARSPNPVRDKGKFCVHYAGDLDEVSARPTCQRAARQVKSLSVKPTFSKRHLLALPALGVLLALAGCGGQNKNSSVVTNSAAPNDSGSKNTNAAALVIISPHGREIQAEFERAFKQENPGASIQWQDQGGSADALRFILSQFQSKRDKDEGIGADVFFGGGLESFMELQDAGDLQALPSDYKVPATLNGVPLRGQNNVWVGAALSGFGILYNKSIATRDKLPVPKTWGDLGNPALLGRIELADPRKSGSAHVAYEIILQTEGWENGWKTLAAMSGNARAFIDSSSTLVNDVSSGEAVFVPAIDFYARAKIAQAGNEKLGYIAPQGQNVITPDPIGILRGAPHKELAEKFVAFVLSPAGQKLWMLPKGAKGGPQQESLFRAPILPALYQPIPKNSLVQTDPYKTKNVRQYDSKTAAARRVVLDDLIGAVLIDNHNAIKGRQGAFGDMNNIMLAPPEEDVMAATKFWGDPVARQNQLNDWRSAAQKKLQ